MNKKEALRVLKASLRSIFCLEIENVVFKFTNQIKQRFHFFLRYAGQNLITRFADNLFHFVDQRLGFFGKLDTFCPPIVSTGLARNKPFLLQLVERANQRRLLNTNGFRQLNLRLFRRQLVNVMQRDSVRLR